MEIEDLSEGNIKCDNSSCDYVVNNVKWEDTESYLNKPCPKCGENLLTEEDYEIFNFFMKGMNALSNIPKETLDNFYDSVIPEEIKQKISEILEKEGISEDEEIIMSVHAHKGLNINIEKDDSTRKD